jgi:hypothetical protein
MAIWNYALTDEERLTDGDAVRVRVKAGAAITAGQKLAIVDGVATFSASGTYYAPESARAGDMFWARYPQGSNQPTPPPANSVLPAITGTPTVGQTLTASTGTWSGSPTFTRQWKRNGVNIAGATAATYLLVVGDATTTITVTVTATNAFGSTPATSAGVGPIAAA